MKIIRAPRATPAQDQIIIAEKIDPGYLNLFLTALEASHHTPKWHFVAVPDSYVPKPKLDS